MRINSLILLFFNLISGFTFGQIVLIGHNEINNSNIDQVKVSVYNAKVLEQQVNTEKKSTFNIKLAFGKKYKIVVQHPECPVMFFEVDATNVPADKQEIRMVHEMDVPFFYRNDEDIDTTNFSKPIQLIYFDGKSKMVTDTAYITAFYKKVIKPQKSDTPPVNNEGIVNLPCVIASQILLNNDPRLAVKNQEVAFYSADGKIISKTNTDRFGNFVLTNVIPSQIHKIKLVVINSSINNNSGVYLNNSSQKFSAKAEFVAGAAEWILNDAERLKLINNGYTSNIGGKLIHVVKGKKSFFANKTVYLSNKRNTIIKKTTTNNLGAFAFDEIKPDQTYFVGIDANSIEKSERIDVINKDDQFVTSFDTVAAARISARIQSSNNTKFNALAASESELRMNVNAKLYGDNTSNPLGKVKILLLNDMYQVIDSTITDDLGLFKFKYLPYLKRFYLSAENNQNQLDLFNNILMYSSDDNLVKVLTHVKGTKFIYKPLSSEMNKIRDIELEDPWLELGSNKKTISTNQVIIEPILFETNQYSLLPAAIETLNKIVSVLTENKTIKVDVSAHTDSKGNDQENIVLSEKRAKAVTDFLTKNGISANRLSAKGFGESKPLNRCKNGIECSELEHAVNRRVEFKIIAK